MGRSVSYLRNALRVNYFEWPFYTILDENNEETGEVEYLDAYEVIDDIREQFMPHGFDKCDKWEDREDHIILEGHGLVVALSEYCGLASLSVAIDEVNYGYCDTDEDVAELVKGVEAWLDANWDEVTKYHNKYHKVGSLSNGEGVFELVK